MLQDQKDLIEKKDLPHIVFRVLNFVSTPEASSLLPNEKLLLIFLAKHHGKKGIYPSRATLAKEMHVTSRYITTLIQSLEEKKLIKIQDSHGKSHHYELLFLSTTLEPQFTSELQITPDPQFQGGWNCSSRGGGTAVPPININYQHKGNNTERAAPKKRAAEKPLSVDNFSPSEENRILAETLGLSVDEETETFLSRHKHAKTQPEFAIWMKNSAKYRSKQLENKKGGLLQEVKSTVKDWHIVKAELAEQDKLQREKNKMIFAELFKKPRITGEA